MKSLWLLADVRDPMYRGHYCNQYRLGWWDEDDKEWILNDDLADQLISLMESLKWGSPKTGNIPNLKIEMRNSVPDVAAISSISEVADHETLPENVVLTNAGPVALGFNLLSLIQWGKTYGPTVVAAITALISILGTSPQPTPAPIPPPPTAVEPADAP